MFKAAFWLAPVTAVLLMAGDPSSADAPWKTKPIPGWTREDAAHVLVDSPWAKTTIASLARMQTEFERRDGGDMGQAHGAGYDGVDQMSRRAQAGQFFGSKVNGTSNIAKPLRLQVVWESATPVRAAELKVGLIEPPTLAGDGYSIAVYGIPGSYFKEDPQKLGAPLKKEAFLRRLHRDDVKPSEVEVFQRQDGLAAVYLFPLSAELTPRDGLIEFTARIGRIGLTQYFDAAGMVYAGKLQ